jgi:hypothetical protein
MTFDNDFKIPNIANPHHIDDVICLNIYDRTFLSLVQRRKFQTIIQKCVLHKIQIDVIRFRIKISLWIWNALSQIEMNKVYKHELLSLYSNFEETKLFITPESPFLHFITCSSWISSCISYSITTGVQWSNFIALIFQNLILLSVMMKQFFKQLTWKVTWHTWSFQNVHYWSKNGEEIVQIIFQYHNCERKSMTEIRKNSF